MKIRLQLTIHLHWPNGGNAHRKADQTLVSVWYAACYIESSKDLPADFLGDGKDPARNDIAIRIAPDIDLQLHASVELFESATGTNQDRAPLRSGKGRAGQDKCRTHFGLRSCSLAALHNFSSDSAGSSSSALTLVASIAAKRRRNFAFVSRSANSGSTCRWRARFTTVNRRSPSSDVTLSALISGAASSVCSSPTSSCTLSKR